MAICHGIRHGHRFAVAGRALNQALLPEVIVGLGQIPLVHMPRRGSGVERSHRAVRAALRRVLLANHGAVTCGPDLSHGVLSNGDHRAQREDHPGCEMAGQPMLLSSREVAKLMAARPRYFVRLRRVGGAELPITRDSGENGGR